MRFFSYLNSKLESVYTTVDSATALWDLIPQEQPFTILGIRGGTNLFGQEGNYAGIIFLINGCITGVMVDHWTGKLYTAVGTTYDQNNKIQFIPV